MQTNIEDRYYIRNVFGISAVEFLWGLGLPVVVESTFLQLFLKNLGASSLGLGMIPFFFFIGTSVFALLSSYMTEGMVFKRRAVVILHLVSALSLLAFGGLLVVMGRSENTLILFFVCYAVFSVCIGMTLPVWLNYLVKILSEEKSTTGLAYMMIAQNAAKLISSLVILKVVEQYAFAPMSSALIFLVVGIFFFLGSLFFFLTREGLEPSPAPPPRRPSFFTFISNTRHHMFRNRNFLIFLGSDLELYIVVTVISFYAAYATEFGGVSPAVAAGIFVALIYIGAIFSNVVLGTLGWLSLKHKAMASKASSMTAVLLMALWCTPASFYVASFLLGAARGTRMIVYAPAVKKLSGLSDATPYFAVAPVLTLPLALGLPLTCGHFLDRMEWMAADAYRLMLGVAVVLLAGTLWCAWRTDFSPGAALAETRVSDRQAVASVAPRSAPSDEVHF